MITSHQAFLEQIAATPDDDTPRLIYADWLEENDDPARAEFIRVQCRLARPDAHDADRVALRAREQALLAEHGLHWLGPLRSRGLFWDHNPDLRWHFRRGFVERLSHAGLFMTTDRIESPWGDEDFDENDEVIPWRGYLRFYQDGSVIGCIDQTPPAQMSRWFSKAARDHLWAGSWVWKATYRLLAGPEKVGIEFWLEPEIGYTGTIHGDIMTFRFQGKGGLIRTEHYRWAGTPAFDTDQENSPR